MVVNPRHNKDNLDQNNGTVIGFVNKDYNNQKEEKIMDKCNCYKEVNRIVGWYTPNSPMIKKFPVCIGTKEQESCQCKGNKLHCDFYPEIRDYAEKDRKK